MKELTVPSNPQAEEGVLSCIFSAPRSILKVVDTIRPDHFLDERYAKIYEAIQAVYGRGSIPNVANVADELVRTRKRPDLNRAQYELDTIKESLTSLQYIEDHAEKVLRTYQFRRVIDDCQVIIRKAYNQEEDTIEVAEERITATALDSDTNNVAELSEAIDRYIREYEQNRKDTQEGKPHGVLTGFKRLDKLMRGFRKSRLYVLAARTSIGKTSLALNIGLNIVQASVTSHDAPKRILFFSLEMDEGELIQRLLSMDSQIDQSMLGDGETTDREHEEIKRRAKLLRKLDMRIVDRTDTLSRIKSEARAAHLKRPLDLIIIDYLQLITVTPEGRAKNELRHEEVAKISKSLKKLSRELKVPILALAQLNRKSEESELPQLTHLGESDQIGRDADCVMFIHCDESELAKRNNSQPYRLNIIIRKHRNGRLGQEALMFRPHLTRFDDVAEEEGYHA